MRAALKMAGAYPTGAFGSAPSIRHSCTSSAVADAKKLRSRQSSQVGGSEGDSESAAAGSGAAAGDVVPPADSVPRPLAQAATERVASKVTVMPKALILLLM